MQGLILPLCCCIPCALTLLQFIKIYKCIELLKNLKQLFEQISFILSGSTPDTITLFCALCDRNIFPTFSAMVYNGFLSGDTFCEAWGSAIDIVASDLLSVVEKTELLSFAESFGFGSVDEQIKICKRFAQFCNYAINKRKSNLAKNGKLYLSGSLLFGALVLILMQ